MESPSRYTPERKIDRQHEDYRKCHQCAREFMANHGRSEFCSPPCKIKYHNLKKGLRNEQAILAHYPRIDLSQPSAEVKKEARKKISQGMKEENLKILSEQKIPPEGKFFTIPELTLLGIDVCAVDMFIPLDGLGRQYGILGPYKFYRTHFEKFLISTKSHIEI